MAEKEFPELYPGWKTVRKLGTGSYGAVYEIQRNLFGTVEKAALKLISIPQSEDAVDELRSSGYDNTSITEHFKGCLTDVAREYALMAEMKGNTNIVYCDDIRIIQQSNGFGWDILIKMELLTPLLRSLGSECSEELVVKLGMDICGALILCKKKNIIHRDIKPQNIFVSENGDYKLGDFGIAKTVEKTMGGTKTGTYNYMAPEIYNNQPYGSGVDIYSLGLVMYWLLNDRRMPFLPLPPKTPSFTEHEEARQRRFSGEPIPAPRNGSEELKRIVLKACAYDPKERYADAREMREDLNRLANGTTVLAEPAHIPPAETESYSEDATVLDEVYRKRKTSPNQVPAAALVSSREDEIPHAVSRSTQEPRRRSRFLGITMCVLAGILVIGSLLLYISIQQIKAEKQAQAQLQEKYAAAEKLYESGEYDQAAAAFEVLGNYQDSVKQMENARLAADYAAAEKLFQAGNYVQAIVAFESLNGYEDSTDRILEAHYAKAGQLLADGEYDQAMAAFTALGDYRDSREQARTAEKYVAAESLAQSGKTAEAAMAFYALDNKERSFALWSTLTVQETISAGLFHTVGLKSDGTVVAAGNGSYGKCNVIGWRDIVAVSAGYNHTVGLKADGMVVAIGNSLYGQCDVSGWKDIVAVSAGNYHTVGLRADGTVVAVGSNSSGRCNVNSWSDIVAISAGGCHTVGLKSDGTVVAVGRNIEGQCNIDGWKDIVAISAGNNHTVGLKADGTVVAVGTNSLDRCSVGGWTDIIAVSARSFHTVGLKSDGTVVAVGSNGSGQCNVNSWSDIVAISTSGYYTVGLKSDGTVVAAGKNSNGQCDVAEWQDIKLPKE